VDALTDVSRADLAKLAGDKRFRVYHSWLSHPAAIFWNQRHAPFRDRKVRRALTLAIDRRELRQVINLPEQPLFDVISTERLRKRGELPEPLPYDPDQAKQLLAEAGWRVRDGDGVRERDGTPFRFEMLVPTGGWSVAASREQAAVYIQAQLRRVGVEMAIRTLEVSAVSGPFKAGRFEAALILLLGGDQEAGHLRHFGEDSPIGYGNAKVIRLLEQAQASLNPDEIDQVYRQLMPIFQADLPVTFLYRLVWTTVAHERLRGLGTPYRFDPVWYMEDLWLEDQRGR
jgi:peptide/nickel transport system substrate-binding protein